MVKVRLATPMLQENDEAARENRNLFQETRDLRAEPDEFTGFGQDQHPGADHRALPGA